MVKYKSYKYIVLLGIFLILRIYSWIRNSTTINNKQTNEQLQKYYTIKKEPRHSQKKIISKWISNSFIEFFLISHLWLALDCNLYCSFFLLLFVLFLTHRFILNDIINWFSRTLSLFLYLQSDTTNIPLLLLANNLTLNSLIPSYLILLNNKKTKNTKIK